MQPGRTPLESPPTRVWAVPQAFVPSRCLRWAHLVPITTLSPVFASINVVLRIGHRAGRELHLPCRLGNAAPQSRETTSTA